MKTKGLSWRIGGHAGEGIDSTGEIFAFSMAKAGLQVYTFREFPSRIRGGYTGYEVRICEDEEVLARSNSIDYLVAFDQDTININRKEMTKGGVVVYDSSSFKAEIPPEMDVTVYPVPMSDLAKEVGDVIMKNMASLGVTAGLLKFSPEYVHKGVQRRFGKKGEAVLKANRDAVEKGNRYALENLTKQDPFSLEIREKPGNLLMSGNDAIAFGALVGGCRFYAGYPITPATEILEWLSSKFAEYGGVLVQAEDEISAINLCIGAGVAGARSMSATSGPGLSLMTEAMSLAGMSEAPVVIVDVQRAGPSTGLPTKPEQGDISHVLNASHGDFPRVVVAPESVQDAFYLTVEAFNIAEKYQCPVIILSDQTVSASKVSLSEDEMDLSRVQVKREGILSEDELAKLAALESAGEHGNGGVVFRRYAITESGISPRPLPGMKHGVYTANSNEHDETGYTIEDPSLRTRMVDKRLRKIRDLWNGVGGGERVYGDPKGTLALVGIGSVRGPAVEALDHLAVDGIRAKHLQLRHLLPFPFQSVKKALRGCKKIITVEHNATGQLARFIRGELGLSKEKLVSILKYDGTPFKPLEIYERVKEVI